MPFDWNVYNTFTAVTNHINWLSLEPRNYFMQVKPHVIIKSNIHVEVILKFYQKAVTSHQTRRIPFMKRHANVQWPHQGLITIKQLFSGFNLEHAAHCSGPTLFL